MDKDKIQLAAAIVIALAIAIVAARLIVWFNREMYGDPTCAIKQCVVVKP